MYDYRKELNRFMNKSITSDGYTAAQLVHSHYQYVEANRNFWIDGMNSIQSALASIELLPENNKPIYLVSFEDQQEENTDGNQAKMG